MLLSLRFFEGNVRSCMERALSRARWKQTQIRITVRDKCLWDLKFWQLWVFRLWPWLWHHVLYYITLCPWRHAFCVMAYPELCWLSCCVYMAFILHSLPVYSICKHWFMPSWPSGQEYFHLLLTTLDWDSFLLPPVSVNTVITQT